MPTIQIKHKGKQHTLDLPDDASFGSLKHAAVTRFNVPIERQKWLGIPQSLSDTASLPPPKPGKDRLLLTLVGSAAGEAQPGSAAAAACAPSTPGGAAAPPAVTFIEDLASPLPAVQRTVAATPDVPDTVRASLLTLPSGTDEHVIARVAARCMSYQPHLIQGFRPELPVIVFDLDYTVFDHRSSAEGAHDLIRPWAHAMFTSLYPRWNLVVWSATSMSWLLTKLRVLQLDNQAAFGFAAALCNAACVEVRLPEGRKRVKPLAVPWAIWPGTCTPANTVAIDDIERNFMLNPGHGLRVRACRHLIQPAVRADDVELLRLAQYLHAIRALPDMHAVDHRRWRRMVRRAGVYESADLLPRIAAAYTAASAEQQARPGFDIIAQAGLAATWRPESELSTEPGHAIVAGSSASEDERAST